MEAFHDEHTPAWRAYAFPLMFEADSKLLGGLPFPDYDQLAFQENYQVLRQPTRWRDLSWKLEKHERSHRTYLRRYIKAAPQFFDLWKCEEIISNSEVYARNHKKYSHVLISRMDLFFFAPHANILPATRGLTFANLGYDYEEPRMAAIRPYRYGCFIPRGMDWVTGVADLLALCDRKAARVYMKGRLDLLKQPTQFLELADLARKRRGIYNSELFLADALELHQVPIQRYEAAFFRSCAVPVDFEKELFVKEYDVLLLSEVEDLMLEKERLNPVSSTSEVAGTIDVDSPSPESTSNLEVEEQEPSEAKATAMRKQPAQVEKKKVEKPTDLQTTIANRKGYKNRCRVWSELGVAGKFEAPRPPESRVERARDFWHIYLVPGKLPHEVLGKMKQQLFLWKEHQIVPQYISTARFDVDSLIRHFAFNNTKVASYFAHFYHEFRKFAVLDKKSGQPLKVQELAATTTSTSSALLDESSRRTTDHSSIPEESSNEDPIKIALAGRRTQWKKSTLRQSMHKLTRKKAPKFDQHSLENITQRLMYCGADVGERFERHLQVAAPHLEPQARFELTGYPGASTKGQALYFGPAREGQQLVSYFYANAIEVNIKAVVWDNNILLEFGKEMLQRYYDALLEEKEGQKNAVVEPSTSDIGNGTDAATERKAFETALIGSGTSQEVIDKVLAKGGDLDTLVQDPRTYINESHWDGRTGKLVQDTRITGSKYREKVFVSQKITEEDNVLQSQLMGLWDYLKLATTATDRAKKIAELGKLFPLFHFPSTRFHV
ncbi:unnamed protein product [Amoebophrya sp. A120]|nr:unnamed protein product [Amoebophrya sp. A120]|eukprot:GSA120T00004932001.1